MGHGVVSGALRHPLVTTFFVALGIRLIVILAMSNFIGYLVWDDSTYHEMARAMASNDTRSWHPFIHWLYWDNATMLVPLTALYKVFGAHEIAGQMLLAVVGAGTAVVVTRLLLEVVIERWALTGGLALAFLPSQVLWSSLILKDAFAWLLLSSLALLACIAARRTGRALLAAGGAIGILLVLLGYLRDHTLVVACWALVLAAVFSPKPWRLQRIAGAAILATLIPLGIGLGAAGISFVAHGAASLPSIRYENARGANTAIVETFGMDPSLEENNPLHGGIADDPSEDGIDGSTDTAALPSENPEIAAAAAALLRSSKEGSSREPPDGPASETGVLAPNIRHLPKGLSVMLLEPFPGQETESTAMRLAQLEMLIWYPLLVLGLIGLWQALKRFRLLAFALFVSGGVLLVYGLSEGNVGTAYRHRGELVWMVVVLAVLGAKWGFEILSNEKGRRLRRAYALREQARSVSE